MSQSRRPALLLVEDDALVRMTVALMLQDDGFGVIEAGTAVEAITLVRNGLQTPVMVTDVDLGAGANGLQLADELRRLLPELAIIFITGRTASVAGRVLGPREAVLPKPFEGSELARVVRELASQPLT